MNWLIWPSHGHQRRTVSSCSDMVIKALKAVYGGQKVWLLPLYPQYLLGLYMTMTRIMQDVATPNCFIFYSCSHLCCWCQDLIWQLPKLYGWYLHSEDYHYHQPRYMFDDSILIPLIAIFWSRSKHELYLPTYGLRKDTVFSFVSPPPQTVERPISFTSMPRHWRLMPFQRRTPEDRQAVQRTVSCAFLYHCMHGWVESVTNGSWKAVWLKLCCTGTWKAVLASWRCFSYTVLGWVSQVLISSE